MPRPHRARQPLFMTKPFKPTPTAGDLKPPKPGHTSDPKHTNQIYAITYPCKTLMLTAIIKNHSRQKRGIRTSNICIHLISRILSRVSGCYHLKTPRFPWVATKGLGRKFEFEMVGYGFRNHTAAWDYVLDQKDGFNIRLQAKSFINRHHTEVLRVMKLLPGQRLSEVAECLRG